MSLHNKRVNITAGGLDAVCEARDGWIRWDATPDNKSGWVRAYHKNAGEIVEGQTGFLRSYSKDPETLFAVKESDTNLWYVGHWHYGKYPNGFDEVAGPFETLDLAKVALELLQ